MTGNREEYRRLLVRGIAHAKANETRLAQRYLEQALSTPAISNVERAKAHFWLSEIATESMAKRNHLEEALGNDPAHGLARRNLAILDGKLNLREIIDADHVPPLSAETAMGTGQRFVCPNCGGRLGYTANGQGLECEHCGYVQGASPDRETEVSEQDFVVGISTAKGHQRPVAARTFECPACGATYLLAPETLSLICAHCDSTYSMIEPATREVIAPEAILPFKTNKPQAERILREWLKANGIERNLQVEVPVGVYLPVWTFDIGGEARWTAREYVNEKWVTVRKEKAVFHDDLWVPSGKPLPAGFEEVIEGYRGQALEAFKPKYLANWLAETYQVSMADAALRARGQALHLTTAQIRADLPLSYRELKVSSLGLVLLSFKLILAPAWICHYRVSGKKYEAVVSGAGENVAGRLPPTRLEKLAKSLFGERPAKR